MLPNCRVALKNKYSKGCVLIWYIIVLRFRVAGFLSSLSVCYLDLVFMVPCLI